MVVNTERLLKLADHLETIEPKSFNIMMWGNDTHSWRCGFVGCAVGHATTIFREDGFILRRAGLGILPVYQERIGLDAIMAFFGLDQDAVLLLFHAESYPTGSQLSGTILPLVVERIRDYVQKVSTPQAS